MKTTIKDVATNIFGKYPSCIKCSSKNIYMDIKRTDPDKFGRTEISYSMHCKNCNHVEKIELEQ